MIEGNVIQHNTSKGFASLSPNDSSSNIFIPPHLVTSFSLRNGSQIRGEVEEYTHNRTGEIKTRLKNVELM